MRVLSVISDYFGNLWQDVVNFFTLYGSEIITRTLFALFVIIGGHYLIKLIILLLRKAARVNDRRVDKSAQAFVINLFKIILNVALAVSVLSIIKVELSGLAVILSAAVLAIGLSIQEVISNFASGVIILSSKPFLTGDWIEVDGVSGSVERVGMLASSLIAVGQQRIVIPNKILVNTKIINYTARQTRRAAVELAFPYQTNLALVREIGLATINADERVLRSPDPAVVVSGFDQRGVVVSFRFHARTVEYWDVYFNFNATILTQLKNAGIEPTYQKVQVELTPDASKSKPEINS